MAEADRKLIVTPATTVKPKMVRFLVPKRIPRGAVSLIVGMPGDGKTLWWAEIAACLTRGDFGDPPARVLVTSTEDSIENVIYPRLQAARAVMENVDFISVQVKDDDAGQIRLPDDVNQLAEVIEEGDYRLLVMDPLLGHINTKLINVFKDEQLREHLMTPLKNVAEANDCAVLAVMHFNKRSEGRALSRVSGSQGGITGPVRSVLFMHRSPEDENQRILTHAKSNYGALADSLAYEIEEEPVEVEGRSVAFPHLRYLDKSPYTTEELLEGQKETPAKVQEAVEFLEAELAGGEKSATAVKAAANELGLSYYSLNTARKKLGIKPRKEGYTSGWIWALPEAPKIKYRARKPEAS